MEAQTIGAGTYCSTVMVYDSTVKVEGWITVSRPYCSTVIQYDGTVKVEGSAVAGLEGTEPTVAL